MALTATEEAQVKALIAQNAALLSLASSEPTIISKLAATKVSLADLSPATTVADSDLFLVRQGSTEKSITKSVLAPIATNAEAQAFTAGKLIDGAKLAAALQGANQSLVANGYQKLPGGLVFQWGTATANTGNGVLATFPQSFATSCLFAGIGQVSSPGGAVEYVQITTKTISNFSGATYTDITGMVTGSITFTWFAIGY